MNPLFVALTALAISMALTPILIRLAPRLRMVDLPDPRKVHALPIPRVGGLGIVIGTLLALLLWMPEQSWFAAYLSGGLILLAFGAADDSFELGHYTKFIGQIAAAVAVVYWGDVWISHMPFLAADLAPEIGKPFTVFALVGVINAINHSDGLDGLAGGETLMSFGSIAYLSLVEGPSSLVMLVAAITGGVFGFLRFNTHPAKVFMGDAGSQFIGFTLGVSVLLLTQHRGTTISMALPALIVGLPIVDILAVLALRMRGGMNVFRATRNHIHHRLLDLGFTHHQVVVIIYTIQALLVSGALVFSYENDAIILTGYLLICLTLFAAIGLAERYGWRRLGAAEKDSGSNDPELRMHRWAIGYAGVTVPAFLVLACLAATRVTLDFGLIAAVIIIMVLASLRLKSGADWWLRLALFCGAACAIYLYQSAGVGNSLVADVGDIYLATLAVAVAVAMRFGANQGFATTPLDVLLVIVVLGGGLLSLRVSGDQGIAGMILRLAVLFYGCELTVSGVKNRTRLNEWSLMGVSLVLIGKLLSSA